MEQLITIKTFQYPYSLAIIKSLLDEAGIFYFVKDEFIVQTHPFYSNAVGGIKLQVRPEDAERAIDILKDSGLWDITETTPLGMEYKGSLKKYITLFALLLLIVLILLFIL